MSEPQATSYDEVPYGDNVFHYSHPDRLATMAMLLGMRPVPVERCRVLELGCGTAANLIPMALALPDSRFVGIDLSRRQIDMGLGVAGALGLANLELRPLSILEVGEDFGKFDYVICHGVYSWVPAEVQDKILRICKENLSPNGVAYVSYNTYPGWHIRGMVREMMRYHVRQFPDPETRVRQARAMLEFLIESVGDAKSAYGGLLQLESDAIARASDTYVYHEHLEEVNHPLYFHQFAERAAAHGLQYVAEALPTLLSGNLSPRVQETLEHVSGDVIQGEQYLDFVRSRTFRRSLLCHAGVALRRPPSPEALTAMRVTGQVKPTAERPDTTSAAAEEFQTRAGTRFSTTSPLLKTALVALFEGWPQAVPFAELWETTHSRLARAAAPLPADAPKALAEALLQCFLASLVELHVHAPRLAREAGERPVASPLARLQAATGDVVTTLRHRMARLNNFERQVVTLLDGSRDRDAVLAALVDTVARGEVDLEHEGQPLRDLEQVRGLMADWVEPTLRRLGETALLLR